MRYRSAIRVALAGIIITCFHYSSAQNACDSSPCRNEATCEESVIEPGYVCLCNFRYNGVQCEQSTSNNCGTDSYTPSGTITSPNYPSNYTARLFCFYNIRVANASSLTLTFSHLEIEQYKDYVEIASTPFFIVESSESTTNDILEFHGFYNPPPEPFTLDTNQLVLSFTTDKNVNLKGWSLSYEATQSPCATNPCENGGSCQHLPPNNYECTCSNEWQGTNCSLPVDPCLQNPCLNGATCVSMSLTDYSCTCAIGWTGDLCDSGRVIITDTDLAIVSGDPVKEGTFQPSFTVNINLTPATSSFQLTGTDLWSFEFYYSNQNDGSGTIIGSGSAQLTPLQASTAWLPPNVTIFTNVAISTSLGITTCPEYRYLCVNVRKGTASSVDYELVGSPDDTALSHCTEVGCRGVEISEVRLSLLTSELREGVSSQPLQFNLEMKSVDEAGRVSGSDLWKFTMFGSASSDGFGSPRISSTTAIQTPDHRSTPVNAGILTVFNNLQGTFNLNQIVCPQVPYFCVEVEKGDAAIPDFTFTGVPDESVLTACVPVPCLGVQITNTFFTINSGAVFIERSLSHSVDFSSFFTTRSSGGSVSGVRLWQVMSFASSSADGNGERYSLLTVTLTDQQASVGNTAGSSSSLQQLLATFNLDGTKCNQIRYMCVSLDKGPDASPDFTLDPLPGYEVLTSCTSIQCNGVIITTMIPRIIRGIPIQYGYSSNSFVCELTVNAKSDGSSIAGSGLWNIVAYVNNQEDGRGVRAAEQQILLSSAHAATSLAAGGQAFFDQLDFNFDLSGVSSCDDVMFLCFELQKANSSLPDFTLEGSTTTCMSISCQEYNPCDSNPCSNGGSCSKNADAYECTCVTGWTGPTCNQTEDNCNPNPCNNGGTCENQLADYSCLCAFGWRGANCSEVDTGVEISATNVVLRTGQLRQSSATNPLVLDVSLTSTASSASASGTGLWKGRAFASSSVSGSGARYAEQDMTFDSAQAGTSITPNSVRFIRNIMLDFDFSNRVCSEGQYLCVEIKKGDDPVPDFILTGVHSSALVGCITVSCVGVEITSVDSDLSPGFQVVERTSSQPISFSLNIASNGAAGSVAGSGLWQLDGYFSSSSDNSGVSQGRQMIQLDAIQAATGINAGEVTMMQNIAASMNLEGVLCADVGYFCMELGRGETPSVDFKLEGSSQLTTCIEVTCRGVAVTDTSYTATSGLLQEGSANHLFTFDLTITSDPQGASIQGTNLWSVELFSSSDQRGIKNNLIDQMVPLTSQQSGTGLLAGVPVILQNLTASLDLSTVSCADIPYLCTRLSRSALASPNFTLQGYPDRDSLTSCKTVLCQEPNTPPYFLPGGDFDNVVIPEDSLPGTVVYMLQGGDNEGDALTYNLLGDVANSLFQVNSMTGEVTLRTFLDSEDVNKYNISVSVSDGQETVIEYSTVLVGDVNDNAPIFVRTPYNATVKESQAPGSVVFTVEARDLDSGENGVVTYELAEASDLFAIASMTGEIILIATLNFEESASYQLRVKAYDGGVPRMDSEEEVIITVGDVQDSDPVFVNLPYAPTVTEETPVGTVIQVVSARDPDVDNPNVIEYSIVSGNEEGFFSINSSTGVLTFADIIDLESGTSSAFSIVVRATETGPTGGASAITEFTIRVEDVNDNDPIFSAPIYSVTISELSPVNTPLILDISVNDADMGVNSEYLISLRGTNRNLFSVTPTSGMGLSTPAVSLASTLDYETSPTYTVEIYATDASDPSRETLSTIIVNVTNENDNSPFFSPQSYLINILENVTVGAMVLRVTATDNDGDQVTYEISDNPSFMIDAETGDVTTTQVLDYEVSTQHIFTVLASDNQNPPRTATAQVTVNVENVNDNAPQFPRDNYDLNSFENEDYGPGNPLLTLEATDSDMDPNNLPVYSFLVTDPDGNTMKVSEHMGLRIETMSGVGYIYTTSPIDYDVLDGPIVATVIAEDPEGLSDTTTINIIVMDTNDNAPVFNQSSYSYTIPENITPGQSIFQVVATDGDRSPQYGTPSLRYYIEPPSTTFSIFQSTGQILTVKTLDYETGDTGYEIQVIAIDSSPPDEMTGTTTVSITIEDVNDNDPQFNPIIQSVSVEEGQAIGILVAEVDASDSDSAGPNADITYSIIDGDIEGEFTIDEITGQIRTSVVLDYENTQSYTLYILAENSATAVLPASGSSTATVFVSVEDLNDNTPEFVDTPYAFEVSEDRSPISTIGVVSAIDMDSGINGELTYSIIAGNTENSATIFQVHPRSGEITLVQSLDRETISSYSLTIQVIDGGASPRIALVNVPVTVLDVNDNSPIWIEDTYNVSITENSGPEVVVQVIATDADIGQNSNLVYEISPSPYFTINEVTGQISTTGPIDREAESTIVLVVNVRDSGFPSRQATPSAQVNFDIIDVNDNAPNFEEPDYLFEIYENQPNGTMVGQISAMDFDPSDDLTYSLQGFDEVFSIDSNSGIITTLQPLNREDVSSYALVARVSDGLNIGEVNVMVTVLDVNDNAPVLSVQNQNVTVSESDVSGTFVTRVIANDMDSDSLITSYLITNGNTNNAFIITSSGDIETAQSLDRELIPYYSLTIEATDSVIAGVQQTGTATVGIIVSDVNDNGPRFTNNSYSVSVPEDVSQKILVVVQATDADEDLNAQINYRIILGNINNAFEIDSITGEIRRGRAPLDREFIDAYSLEVEASNPGSNLPRDFVRVNIAVEDINDEVPVFSQLVYQRQNLDENSPIGTLVITVIATDTDTGAGGEVKYYIEQGNDDGKFALDEDTGVITVANALNYESVKNYTLLIIARDQASPFNTGFSTVTIQLSNVNEQPQFSPAQYRKAIPEDIPSDTVVLQVNATDPDNNPLTYSISPNTPSSILSLFSIDPITGEIKTSGPLDREVTDLYTFNVLASDGGAREGSAGVIIDVEDVNDNNPMFDVDSIVLVSIPEDVNANSPVTSFRATDPDADLNGQVTYRIASGNTPTTFYLDVGSNNLVQLRTSRTLDREEQMDYSIVVVVSDAGSPSLNNSITVNVTLEDVNDNPPQFTASNFTGRIEENAAEGTPVVTVSATDVDAGNNARLTYFIQSGNQGNAFQIDRITGEITASSNPTDREQLTTYNLMVQVTDDGIPQFSDSVPVVIVIVDENDNTPTFEPSSVTYLIQEGPSSVGENLGPITANDDDDGDNGHVQYMLLDDGDGTFIISPETGLLTVVSELDRETNASYVLTVIGVDQAVIEADRLTGTATVTVVVQDLNDNAPSFDQPSYGPVDVGEEQQGLGIGIYTATDNDENSLITYSIDDMSQGLFEIDPSTGVLVLKPGVTLDYESETSYIITITASDDGSPPLTGITMVLVSVTNINDNTPEFEGAPYAADVNDDTPPNTAIIQITANDADNQTDGLRYDIIRGNPDGLFRIDPMTGIVYLNQSAGNYGGNMFSLTVEVSDNPTDPSNAQTSIATLTVSIISVEKPPTFTSGLFMGSVDEGIEGAPVTMTPVISVSGDPSQVTFSIIGEDSDYFIIDPATGQLTTKVALDADVKDIYDFEVVATNSKGETDTADVNVIINNLNDNSPVFFPPQMSINISEGTVGGEIIGQVNASDPDGFPITYFISSGSEGKFIIDPNTGVIRVAPGETIDGTSTYTLIISAIDGGNPPQTGTSVITINVENINNSPPYFPSDQLYRVVSIPEDTPVGKNVVNITAMDDDEDADLEYTITDSVMYDSAGREVMPSANGRSNSQQLFVLDSRTGALNVDMALDRELVETVRLTIKATDTNSVDESQADSVIDAIVLIQITDINDNTPVIEQLNVTALVIDVTENEERGTLLTTFVASDADKDANGMLEYLLVDENTGLVELIRETGHLVVNGEIDYEQIQWLNFTVQVQDMGTPSLFASIPVFLRVIDLNDNNPVFQDTPYETLVSEGASIGSPIGVTAHATDQDSGAFGEVIYTLSGGNARFSIDQNTGEIFVANQLVENQNEYFITVTATDNPSGASTNRLTATVGVTIHIVIENKFTPIPGQSTYYFEIFENTPASTFVGEVQATDNDIGEAGDLTYALSDTSPEFVLSRLMIDENLGVIQTTAPFDREVHGDRVEFTVVISDNGTPMKSSTSTIVLTIKDVNDNAPVFDSTTYSTSLPEGLAVGSSVYTVLASDSDTNSSITYSIIQGNSGNSFTINPLSGKLTNNQVLDFDIANRYNLTIAATDQGGLIGTTQLFIEVLDLQFGSITFSETIYRASLAEDVPINTYVNQVIVNDNGKPVIATFSIIDGNEDGAFIIDPNTGNITTNKTLDWESKSEYYLVIEAKTDDTIAQTLLQVTVNDVNDETPTFQQASYSVRILENTEVGMEIEEVMAVDNDADDGGGILYSILNGNDDGHFRIDNMTGKIYLLKVLLDRIPPDFMYELVVEARDSGISQLSSTVNVFIEVIDINDHAPIFIMPIEGEVYNVPENEPIGYIIGYASAIDNDFGRNAEIRYDFLRTENVSRDWKSFSINATSGEIQTSVMFDREEKDLYTIVVVASDQGEIQLATPHELTVVITDKDDNLPMFEQLVSGVPVVETMDVDENSAVGTVVGTVPSASDRDTEEYSNIYYYIVEGNSKNHFSIDKLTGQLTVNGEIDRELESSYRILVKASNDSDYKSSGPYNVTIDSSLKEVVININDVNDNGPIFSQNPYFAAVAIDATVGKSIIRVSASDMDVGEETILYDITYSNLYDNSKSSEAADYFSIDKETGLVFLNKDLTSVKTGYFEVGLLAEDSKDQYLRDYSVLQVSLLDKDERIILIIDASVDEVRSKEVELTELLSNITGGIAVIDSIETYIDADGVTHLDKTQVSLHVINKETGEVEDAAKINILIQASYEEIQKLFNIDAYYALSDIEGGSSLGFFEWMWLILAILIFLAALIAAILLCCCVRRKKVDKNEDYHLTYWKGKKVRKVDEYGMDVLSSDSGIGADEADRGKKNLYELQEVTLNMDSDIKDNRQIKMTSFITSSGSTPEGYVNRGYQRLEESLSNGNLAGGVSTFAAMGAVHGASNAGLHGASNAGYAHSQQTLQQNVGSASVHVPGQQNISIGNISPLHTTTSHSNFGSNLYVSGTGVTSTRHSENNLRRVGSSDSLFSQGSVTVKVGPPSNRGSTLLTRTHATTPQSGDWQQSSTIHVPSKRTTHKDSFVAVKSEPDLVHHPDRLRSNSFKTTVEKKSLFKDGSSVHEEYTRSEETTSRLLPASYAGNNMNSTSMLQNLHFHDVSDDDDDDPKERYAYAYNVDDRLSLSDSDGP